MRNNLLLKHRFCRWISAKSLCSFEEQVEFMLPPVSNRTYPSCSMFPDKIYQVLLKLTLLSCLCAGTALISSFHVDP